MTSVHCRPNQSDRLIVTSGSHPWTLKKKKGMAREWGEGEGEGVNG